MSTQDDLADFLHNTLCSRGSICNRYKDPESAHHDFYQLRAEHLIERLEPRIGIANVLPVMQVVLSEVDL